MKPLTQQHLDVTVTGGRAPYTCTAVGFPPGMQVQGCESVGGELFKGAANIGWQGSTTLLAQLSGGGTGPNPGGVSYLGNVMVRDANGRMAYDTVGIHVNPLEADIQLRFACACVEEAVNCDLHAVNMGPDAAPDISIQAQLNNVVYSGDHMPPATTLNGQNISGGTFEMQGDTLVWTSDGTVPKDADFASWPVVEPGEGGGERTTGVETPYSIDPNLSDNGTTEDIESHCSSKTVQPAGPVCESDTMLFVMAMGQVGKSSITITDQLHSCIDLTTVNQLMPPECQLVGSTIACPDLPIPSMPDNFSQMVSFVARPKASCPSGTIITNMGIGIFNDGVNVRTNETQNVFCKCSEKGTTCGASSAASSVSSKASSGGSQKSSAGSQNSSGRSQSAVSRNSSAVSQPSSSQNSSGRSQSAGSQHSSIRSRSDASRSQSVHSQNSSVLSQGFSSQRSSAPSRSEGSQNSSGSKRSRSMSSQMSRIDTTRAPSSSSMPASLAALNTGCGDGIVGGSEECDDRDREGGDGCNERCQLEDGFCGDAIVQTLLGEQCEPSLHDGSLWYGCVQCRFVSPFCGDGIVQRPAETCDLGVENSDLRDSSCRLDCTVSRCGDGVLDTGESCDDGNLRLGDGCDRDCAIEHGVASVFGMGGQAVDLEWIQSLINANVLRNGNAGAIAGQGVIRKTPPEAVGTPQTGPGLIAVAAAGAAGGLAWMRRRRSK